MKLDYFDSLLQDEGPAVVRFCRKLEPVEGKDAWIFPPTFAQSESVDEEEQERGGVYQIDPLPEDPRRNVCVIDSVGSQANRIEPIFKLPRYMALVPQVRISLREGDEVNLLDAGHRAADAVIRFSKVYGPRLSEAFKLYQRNRDCSGLLAIAPTSLIFGVWDSRATGAKIQRVVRSIIRAYNVVEARRSATYQAAYDYTGNGIINPELDVGSGKNNPLSQEGFKYSLAKGHGGVLVKGDIQQDGAINLVALRVLSSDIKVRRYLLALALVALSYRDQGGFNLREGCLLCAASEADFRGRWSVIHFDSTQDSSLFDGFTHDMALSFADKTIDENNDGMKILSPDKPDEFDKETAEKWLAIEKKKRKSLAKTKHPAQVVKDEANTEKKAVAKKNAGTKDRSPEASE